MILTFALQQKADTFKVSTLLPEMFSASSAACQVHKKILSLVEKSTGSQVITILAFRRHIILGSEASICLNSCARTLIFLKKLLLTTICGLAGFKVPFLAYAGGGPTAKATDFSF